LRVLSPLRRSDFMIDDHDPYAEREADLQAALADVDVLADSPEWNTVLCYFGEMSVTTHLKNKIHRLAEGEY